MSTKPHRAGCHVWKACATLRQEVQELNPDILVECYLDVKYHHYDPVELTDLSDVNANFAYLANSDSILTVNETTIDNVNACTSIDDNFKELSNACLSWDQNTEAVSPKWLEHHQSGHLIKDKTSRAQSALRSLEVVMAASCTTSLDPELPVCKQTVEKSSTIRSSRTNASRRTLSCPFHLLTSLLPMALQRGWWNAQDYCLTTSETSSSGQAVVVIRMQVCRSHDARQKKS